MIADPIGPSLIQSSQVLRNVVIHPIPTIVHLSLYVQSWLNLHTRFSAWETPCSICKLLMEKIFFRNTVWKRMMRSWLRRNMPECKICFFFSCSSCCWFHALSKVTMNSLRAIKWPTLLVGPPKTPPEVLQWVEGWTSDMDVAFSNFFFA